MKAYAQSLLLALVFFNHVSFAADWPQWRHDARRSGATEEELPGNLKRQWMLPLGKPVPAYDLIIKGVKNGTVKYDRM